MPTMTDDELGCIRFLAERFDRGGRSLHVRFPDVPGYSERGEHATKDMMLRFATHGFVHRHSTDSVMVKRTAWAFVQEISTPRPVNYVENWKANWFGRKWFAFLVVAFFLLGSIAMLIVYIREVLSYFGISVPSP